MNKIFKKPKNCSQTKLSLAWLTEVMFSWVVVPPPPFGCCCLASSSFGLRCFPPCALWAGAWPPPSFLVGIGASFFLWRFAIPSWSGRLAFRVVGFGPSFLLWGFAIPSGSGRLALHEFGVGTYFPLWYGEAVFLTTGLPLPSHSWGWQCHLGVWWLALPSWGCGWPVFLVVGVGLSSSGWPFLLAVRGSPLLLGVGVGSSWSWPSGLVFGPSFWGSICHCFFKCWRKRDNQHHNNERRGGIQHIPIGKEWEGQGLPKRGGWERPGHAKKERGGPGPKGKGEG